MTHGIHRTYTHGGCRCDECRAAHNQYMRVYRKRKRRERVWNLAERVTDLLIVDGGWWTLHALADRFDAHPDSIMRSMRHNEAQGLVVRRQVQLATTANGRGYDTRVEWRTV